MPDIQGSLIAGDVIGGRLSSEGSVNSALASDSTLTGVVSSSEGLSGSISSEGTIDGEVVENSKIDLIMSPAATLNANLTLPETRSGGGGTNDYEELINKPKINNVTLIKNKTFSDLGLNSLSNMELESLLT